MVQQVSTNTYGVAKWIVDATLSNGTHSTIAAAITSASSGDTIFVRPGTYTENLTLKAGVNIASFVGDADTPNVTIVGKATMTTAGTCTISGIRLQTNSDFLLAVTGTLASIVNLENCYLNCSNNTGISFTTSSASAQINAINCFGNLGTTGIGIFASSSAGQMYFEHCTFFNTGASTTASTISAGNILAFYNIFPNPITTSSSGFITGRWSAFSGTNVNGLNLNNTSNTSVIIDSAIAGGTASSVSVGAGAIASIYNCEINSSNTNAITGTGTITFDNLTMSGNSNEINTTTQAGFVSQNGPFRSPTHPAFSAYLASTANNKTGNGATYQLGTDALTEIYDQGSNFNTNGTFTAPYTGRYRLNASVHVTGCTIATTFVIDIVTTLRTYRNTFARAASANAQQLILSIDADMTATNTAIVNVIVTGEAGDTDDITGSATLLTFFQGHLIC